MDYKKYAAYDGQLKAVPKSRPSRWWFPCQSARKTSASVAQLWHNYGMSRIRVSTTVDEGLLRRAREIRSGANDSALIDEALAALLAIHRASEIDANYAIYDEHPLEEPDEWGV